MSRLGTVLLLVPVLAHAQTGPLEKKTQADALFDDAKRLSAQGDFAKACPDYEASLQILPQLGVELNLADCYEKIGRLASAQAMWRLAAAAAAKANDARDAYARQRATDLEKRLDRLVIQVSAPSSGLAVTRDGTPIIAALFGKEVPVDEGAHVIRATAGGAPAWEKTIEVSGEGQTMVVEIPAIGGASVATDEQHPGRGRKIAGVAIGAAGVALLGVTAVLGGVAKSKWDGVASHCPMDLCDDVGFEANRDAKSLAHAANVTFAAGAIGLAVGVILYVTAPKSHAEHAARVVPTENGLAAAWTF
jgi:hypothetical protein